MYNTIMKILKRLSKNNLLQPLLLFVLVILVGFLIFRSASFGQGNNKQDNTQKLTVRNISFESATENFLKNSYEIYTKGSILVKTPVVPNRSIEPGAETQSEKIEVIDQKYDDLFFNVVKGEVKTFSIDRFGDNRSIVSRSQKELFVVDHGSQVYFECTSGATQEDSTPTQDLSGLCTATYETLQESLPLVPLLKDYKESKFIPEQKAFNIYEGKWKNEKYTGGEVRSIVIQIDSDNGLFSSFNIVNDFTDIPSQVYFDYKETSERNIDAESDIPADYKRVEYPGG